jgi:hypothetical protein
VDIFLFYPLPEECTTLPTSANDDDSYIKQKKEVYKEFASISHTVQDIMKRK